MSENSGENAHFPELYMTKITQKSHSSNSKDIMLKYYFSESESRLMLENLKSV